MAPHCCCTRRVQEIYSGCWCSVELLLQSAHVDSLWLLAYWSYQPWVYKRWKHETLSCSLLCDWVKTSWDAVPADMVKVSFTSCAITASLDGSEDDEVHCFKPAQPYEGGRSILADKIKHFVTDPLMRLITPSPQMRTRRKLRTINEVCRDYDDEEDSDGDSSSDDNQYLASP